MPAVSVLMPVYNGERHLRPAIESILSQTFSDFELLIVDDGSTDGSRAIAEEYADRRIRVIALGRNMGLSAALNAGLREAASPLVARQDADDISVPTRLERQVAAMRAQPALALLGSHGYAINEDGAPAGTVWRPIAPESIRWYSLFDNPFAHTSVIFQAAVIRDELGGFDAAFDPFSQDYALWCRVMERHAFGNLPDRLVRYRVRSSSIIGALDRDKADLTGKDDRYRERFADIVQRIVRENALRILNVQDETDAALMAKFVLGLDARAVGRFLRLFERLLKAFKAQHPGALHAVDFNDTLARQFDALAFRVTPPSRRSAQRIFSHALYHHPALVTHVSWPRMLATVLFGKAGRESLASWRQRYVPVA